MQNENIAQKLIRGSHNIDRMRAEIDQVVRMIVGLLEKHYLGLLNPKAEAIPFGVDLSYGVKGWQVNATFNPRKPQHNRFFVGYWLDTSSQPYYTVIERKDPTTYLKTEDVALVYQALPEFVEGIMNKYPNIASKLQPFICASGAL
jgi:hypothetical protein